MLSLAAIGAPAAGAAAEGLAAIAPAVGYLVLAALLLLYRQSLKRVIVGFAHLIDVPIPIPHFHDPHPLHGVSSWIVHQADNVDSLIGAGMLYCEKATVYLLLSAWHLLTWTAREIEDLAVTVEHALVRVAVNDLPKVLRLAIAPVLSRLHGIDRLLGQVEAQARAQLKRLQHGIDRVEGIATKTIPKRIARAEARVGRLERTLSGLRGHAGAIEKALGATAIATVVAAALSRLGLRWLRCNKVGKVGRFVCSDLDGNLLEQLLLDALAVGVAFNLRTFARELGEVTDEAASAIHRFAG